MSISSLIMSLMTNTFDYDDFMHRANAAYMHHPENQRYGQFLMNYLTEHHPDILVPDDVDCFYDNTKVPKFMRFIFNTL
jgi:hypothetical protein